MITALLIAMGGTMAMHVLVGISCDMHAGEH